MVCILLLRLINYAYVLLRKPATLVAGSVDKLLQIKRHCGTALASKSKEFP